LIDIQRLAAETLCWVRAGRSLGALLNEPGPARLEGWARAAYLDATYGALRHLGELRACLAQLLRQPLRQEIVECLLIVALYQLRYTRAAPHAVVDHAVRCATALRAARVSGLVNAVLRNFLRDQHGIVSRASETEEGRYSHAAWWVEKLRGQYPTAWSEIVEAGNQHPPFTLRVRTARVPVDSYLEELRAAGIDAYQTGPSAVTLARPLPVAKVPGFEVGWVSVQDAGAQLAASLLDLQAGMRVLDACAAPGGKACHILELAPVRLLALDCDDARLRRVSENLDRLGLSAELIAADAAAPEKWWDGVAFDRILADVPCSASGVVRRHPDVKWLRRPTDVAGFAREQAALLDALWQTLGRGGKLLYSTCSVFREENQDQAEGFVSRHRDARRLPVAALPDDGMLLPNRNHDGFYYALFEKD
jgi:16S rRNA (cytosine967-C5)-methyltransferase